MYLLFTVDYGWRGLNLEENWQIFQALKLCLWKIAKNYYCSLYCSLSLLNFISVIGLLRHSAGTFFVRLKILSNYFRIYS